MAKTTKIPFQSLIDALLNPEAPLPPMYVYRLSDIEAADMAMLQEAWPNIPSWRRKALMEEIEELGETDSLLSFETVARFALGDQTPEVRLPAIRAMWEYENEALIPRFLEMLENDASIEVRAAAASALGKYVYLGEVEDISLAALKRVEDALLRILEGQEDELVRRRALESLGFSSRPELTKLIETAYASTNNQWLISALLAMGRSAHERWHGQVLAKLDDKFPEVRAEAARAAGELEIHDARAVLLEMLEDPDPNAREASIWALSQIGGEGVREALEAMYERTQDEEEADYIDTALDNLSFTEDMQLFALMDIPEEEDLEDREEAELFEDDEDSED